jgi:hypothetical protein
MPDVAPRRRLAALALGTALLLGACEADQDPGVDPGTGSGVTSDTLPDCPRGGPDATTPAAGCISDDGTVQRP